MWACSALSERGAAGSSRGMHLDFCHRWALLLALLLGTISTGRKRAGESGAGASSDGELWAPFSQPGRGCERQELLVGRFPHLPWPNPSSGVPGGAVQREGRCWQRPAGPGPGSKSGCGKSCRGDKGSSACPEQRYHSRKQPAAAQPDALMHPPPSYRAAGPWNSTFVFLNLTLLRLKGLRCVTSFG